MKQIPALPVFFGLLLFAGMAHAQPDTDRKVVVPGISVVALEQGEMEFNLVNTLNPGTPYFEYSTPPFGLTGQETMAFSSLLQFTYGISRNRRFNVGLDVNYGMQRFTGSDGEGSSPSHALLAGPRIRWRPFGAVGSSTDIALQHYAWFPVSVPEDTYKDKGSPIWGNELIITQFFRNRRRVAQWLLVGYAGFYLMPRLKDEELDKVSPFRVPLALLAGYYPERNTMLYLQAQWNPEFGSVPWDLEVTRYRRRASLAAGPGLQYGFSNNFFVNLSYLYTLYRQGDMPEHSIGLGLRLSVAPR